jgi:hypothetical protein
MPRYYFLLLSPLRRGQTLMPAADVTLSFSLLRCHAATCRHAKAAAAAAGLRQLFASRQLPAAAGRLQWRY